MISWVAILAAGSWDVSLGNVVTWVLVATGFIGTHYVSVKLLTQRMNGFAKWAEKHQEESEARNELLQTMGRTIERLSVLSELAERRIEKLEDRPSYVRSSDPPPYYGPERRRGK